MSLLHTGECLISGQMCVLVALMIRWHRDNSGNNIITEKEESDNSIRYALNDISLIIESGEKIAICGRTGSGKSSIINILLRLLSPIAAPQTTITIDGLDLGRIPRATLRSRIICLPQDAYFLPGNQTIKQNLDPYEAATLQECEEVLELAGLSDVLGTLEDVMHADSFSQGQQQLFSLSRAVLRRRTRSGALSNVHGEKKEHGILLLDEFTASVDRETEKVMLDIVRREFETWTVIAVVHRVEGLAGFDRVVVMDEGSIVEIVTPEDNMTLRKFTH